MKNILITLYILSLFVGVLIACFIPDKSFDRIDTIISISGAISTIFTLILAFLLFNKFVIDESFFEKQKDAVFSLLDELRVTSFLVVNEKHGLRFEPIEADKEYVKSLLEEHFDRLVAYSYESLIKLEQITDFRKNIYLPKSISSKLEKLSVYIPGSVDSDRIDEYVFIVFKKIGTHESHKEDLENFCKPTLYKELTVREYLEIWEQLISSIKNWMVDNSITKIELNL